MSGIVGIINLDGKPVDWKLLRQMTNFMAYRGPDAQGIWSDGYIGFGHTMLRTTFESEREKQPCSLDGQVWITADARVDARKELIQKLEVKERHDVASATDVELILHAYHVWGEDCIKYLLGDFSFAIWDGQRQRLFCARDHFGVKLFYYARVANCFIFSNTLSCVRKHPAIRDKFNELAIGDFLLFGYNAELSTTTFSDIQRLPPAHELTLSEGALRIKRYWSLPIDGHIIRYKRASDYVDHFKELLREAMADRLRTERVGIFMSGGLDSPTMAATVCELREKQSALVDLRAYCVVYDQAPDDERYYSELVAQALRIPIEHTVVDDYKMFERWDQPELQRPEPYDWALLAMDYDVLKAVDTHSRVALYGEDGDALLFPSTLVDMLKGMPTREVIADVVRYVLSHRRRPLLGLGILSKVRRWTGKEEKVPSYPPWLNKDFAARLALPTRWKEKINSQPSEVHPVRREAYRRLTSFLQPLFESVDPGITFVPVEHRLPLFDLRLVDYVLSIPPLPWCANKELLRTTMRDTLPELVRLRPKTPLAFDPYQVRLQQPGAAWVDDFQPTSRLLEYVNIEAVPKLATGNYESNVSWSHLRPLILDYWFRSLEGVN